MYTYIHVQTITHEIGQYISNHTYQTHQWLSRCNCKIVSSKQVNFLLEPVHNHIRTVKQSKKNCSVALWGTNKWGTNKLTF